MGVSPARQAGWQSVATTTVGREFAGTGSTSAASSVWILILYKLCVPQGGDYSYSKPIAGSIVKSESGLRDFDESCLGVSIQEVQNRSEGECTLRSRGCAFYSFALGVVLMP